MLGLLVLAEIGYPLASGVQRARLVVVTVLVGYTVSVAHAAATRAWRAATALVLVTTGGGFAVEATGVATGLPFGPYAYGTALGPRLLGVPLVIPLAWTWMAWPAWLVAGRLTQPAQVRARPGRDRAGRAAAGRVLLAGIGLAGWDLFLDPQMVAERYWIWRSPRPTLPAVPDVPVSNYLGWLVVATVLMGLLSWSLGPDRGTGADRVMYALYLWTYVSGVLGHAVFLGLPASALWGGLAMGLVAVPLAVRLVRESTAW